MRQEQAPRHRDCPLKIRADCPSARAVRSAAGPSTTSAHAPAATFVSCCTCPSGVTYCPVLRVIGHDGDGRSARSVAAERTWRGRHATAMRHLGSRRSTAACRCRRRDAVAPVAAAASGTPFSGIPRGRRRHGWRRRSRRDRAVSGLARRRWRQHRGAFPTAPRPAAGVCPRAVRRSGPGSRRGHRRGMPCEIRFGSKGYGPVAC